MTSEPVDVFPLSWQPELADYQQAFSARNRARGAWRKIAVIAGLGAVLAVVSFSLGHPGPAAVGAEVAVLLPLVVVPITRFSTWLLWRRHPVLHAPAHAEVHPSGITTDGPLLDLSGQLRVGRLPEGLPWTAVQSVLETERVFVVQLVGKRGKQFTLLAKRGFAGPAGPEVLRGVLAGAGKLGETRGYVQSPGL